MRRSTKAKLLIGAVVFAIVGANVLAAQAVVVPTTRTASPGVGYHWGIAWNSTNFPNQGTTRPPLTFTGYGFEYGGYTTDREALMLGRNNTSQTVTPVMTRMTEPYKYSNDYLAVAFHGLGYVDARAGATQPYPAFGATNQATGVTDGAVWCSTTEWATSASFIKRASTFNYSSTGWGITSSVELLLLGSVGYNWAANCPYIQAFQTNLCYYATTTATTYTCLTAKWTAESAFDKTPYSNKAIDKELCSTAAGAAVSIDCAYVVGVTDPTDFNQVCGKNQPTASWGDFSWFGKVIGFYTKCLWEPNEAAGGWDRNGDVATALEDSSFGDLHGIVEGVPSQLTVIESCGPIVEEPDLALLEGFSVDTCNWTWAEPIKSFIALVVIAMSGSWILLFVTAAISGVVNRSVPNPITTGDKE